MKIREIRLKNFRNYESLKLKFNPNINIFVGNNGSGKTNIIESIYVLALTKSFRGLTYDVLIQNGFHSCEIEGLLEKKINHTYRLEMNSDGKKAFINNNKVEKMSNYISNIQVILFTPDDMNIIKDTPSVRRKFLNIEISQLDNSYLNLINNYNKLLKQRNSYLKTMAISKLASEDYLNIITDKLIRNGLLIYQKRFDFINNINLRIDKNLKKISNKSSLFVEYLSDYKLNNYEEISKKYKRLLEKDMFNGQTTFGIHKDDIKFIFDEDDVRLYGSEGQQKNTLLAFKLSEVDLFKKSTGEYPILILDDLFSELDKYKIKNILKFIQKNIQTFITVTEVEKLDEKILNNSTVFRVKNQKAEVIK